MSDTQCEDWPVCPRDHWKGGRNMPMDQVLTAEGGWACPGIRPDRSGACGFMLPAHPPAGGALTESQRFQVQEARDILGTWELSRDPDAPFLDREAVLANTVRALLAVIGEVAPKAGG